MAEREVRCVEEVAVKLGVWGEAGNNVGGPVERVHNNGMAEGLSVYANLMSTTGFDADFDESEGTIPSGETFDRMEV
jgi:hypothetical protein